MKSWIVKNIENFDAVRGLAVKFFEKKPQGSFQLIMDSEYEKKTTPQLRYLHGVVLPLLSGALHDAGIISVRDSEVAKEWLKEEAKYGKYYTINPDTRPEVRFIGKSFRDATKEYMIDIINLAIERAAFLNVVIPAPEDFNLTEGH